MLPVGDHIVRHLSISLDLALFGGPFPSSPCCSQRWSAGPREVLPPRREPQGNVGFPSAFRRDGEGEGRGGGGREGGWGCSTTGGRGRRVPSPCPCCSRGSHTLGRLDHACCARGMPAARKCKQYDAAWTREALLLWDVNMHILTSSSMDFEGKGRVCRMQSRCSACPGLCHSPFSKKREPARSWQSSCSSCPLTCLSHENTNNGRDACAWCSHALLGC